MSKPQESNATSTSGTPSAVLPLWAQLPKPPNRCPISGLSRSKINELILPCEANGYKPPVLSKSLKATKWATRGIRLYSVPSLLSWIEGQDSGASTSGPIATEG